MVDWLNNLELAFAADTLPLEEWLPVVEAGLGNLSVGVIPPALDQVLAEPSIDLAILICKSFSSWE